MQLQVRNVGRVPGSFETHQGYSWVDPVGRSVSPPPEIDRVGRYDTRGERKSGLMLLKDSDERKVLVSQILIFMENYTLRKSPFNTKRQRQRRVNAVTTLAT